MKLIVRPTDSTEYSVKLEPKDKMYHQCTWATVLLNHGTYTLFAETDCGNFTYGCTPTPEHESFLHLMCCINEDYLLGKISDESVLDFDKSKENTIKSIKDNYTDILTDTGIKRLCDEIEDIEDCGEECFCLKADEIMDGYELHDTFEIIDCVKDYPIGAKVFVKLFCKILQPELKKQLAHILPNCSNSEV